MSVGAHSLFARMPRPSGTMVDDEAMMNIIHDGGSYEYGQLDDSQPEEQPQSDTLQPNMDPEEHWPPGADPKKKQRGLNFFPEEDELVCEAWFASSINLFQGTEQRAVTFC